MFSGSIIDRIVFFSLTKENNKGAKLRPCLIRKDDFPALTQKDVLTLTAQLGIPHHLDMCSVEVFSVASDLEQLLFSSLIHIFRSSHENTHVEKIKVKNESQNLN